MQFTSDERPTSKEGMSGVSGTFLKKIISPELFGVFGVATKREAELKRGDKSYVAVEDDDDGDGDDDNFNRVGPQDTFLDLGWLSLGWKIFNIS